MDTMSLDLGAMSLHVGPMNVKPLGDRVAIKRIEANDMSNGGIYIPENAKERPQEGTVVAVGEGKMCDNGYRINVSVGVGDRVLVAKHSGHEVDLDGEKILLVRETDLLCVIQP